MKTLTSLFRRAPHRGHFETLLAPHVESLYRLAYRFTGSRDDAEDLVQELLTRLYPRFAEFAEIEALRPWLSRALYHLFIDNVRRQRRDPLHGSTDVALAEHQDHTQHTEGLAEQALLQRRLAAAMAHLNPDQRALVALHDMEGYALPELAQILDTPLGTLKSRLHRAREQLRRALQMEPFSESGRLTE